MNNLNQAIASAANSLYNMDTANGPDGGNNACAWSINRVLQEAGIAPLGDNPNYVPSLVEALQNGRGEAIAPEEAQPGDLVVASGEAHIGVILDDGSTTVLSNSSSRGRFRWQSDLNYDGYYGGSSTIYRLLS
jgi:cell wall-associated NlpC family hydrolase